MGTPISNTMHCSKCGAPVEVAKGFGKVWKNKSRMCMDCYKDFVAPRIAFNIVDKITRLLGGKSSRDD